MVKVMNPKPRAFDPSRLRKALRSQLRTLLGVTLVAMFGGALVGRLAVPNGWVARATARIVGEPHAVVSRALDDEQLEGALRAAELPGSAAALRPRVKIGFSGQDRLQVEVRAAEAAEGEAARRVADALVERYVALANARSELASSDQAQLLREATLAAPRARREERELARAEDERAQTALTVALAREGVPELDRQRSALVAAVAQTERDQQAASLAASAARARVLALRELGRQAAASAARQALLASQRELSRALAESSAAEAAEAARIASLRARIRQLQAQTVELGGSTVSREVEARAQDALVRELAEQLAQKRAALRNLDEIAARVAPLVARADHAHQRLLEVERRDLAPRDASQPSTHLAAVAPAASRVSSRAELVVLERRGLRLLVSLLAPLIALAALAAFYALRELRGLRVCAPTELAHWLAVPVLTTSTWPRQSEALEALIDQLADPALDALGTTLVLPVTELERPLAATLAAQLNARAQRHYRSPTGSRVTIAQNWHGELDSSRIQRAAEVADRVLWVVAADAHRGEVLAQRRELVARTEHVAAVLVDAEPGMPRSVGQSDHFWITRQSEPGAAPLLASARVPLH
jgi:hypothetical protein